MPGVGPGRRTIVKVCGLTSLEDARAACEAGADWLGFVVHGDSPRRIDPKRVASIVESIAPEFAADRRPQFVAVMVDATPRLARELAERSRANRVQLHRVAGSAWPAEFPYPAAFSVPVGPDGRPGAPLPDPRHLLMLDTGHAERAGGTGAVFPWEAAVALARQRPVLLAGGLGPENVAAALARVRPFGVDASSRLESTPGIKDHALVRSFVTTVRDWDARIDSAG
ncbi:MAG: phosphoribosylanthranilate isomerase [Candidatus Eisenbacteria bacterium]|nr:phosphoribosylanthranilate isomerase [Candidatus Eisenbacteria bacterium]